MKKFFICIITLLVGFVCGSGLFIYKTLPETDHLHVGEEVYYTNSDISTVLSKKVTGEDGELSIHFLELGNKYTGDCTYIKYGETDILIDCGSKSSSIPYVENYLKTYMSDDTIEYVIVTHSHTDHFAGFATSEKVSSIFDLFKIGTIIDFGSATTKDPEKGSLKNYIRERTEAKERYNTTHYDVSVSSKKGNNKIFKIGENNEVELEILYNYYYDHHESSSDNNYSVCSLIRFDGKNFLFTGDLEEHKSNGETKLLADNQILQDIANSGKGVDLYKAGHHGSKTSSSENFMAAMKPKMICVCCCAGSAEYTDTIDNQFPTQEFINVVAKYTKYIYVTTLCVDWENDEFTSMNGNIVVIASLVTDELGIDCSNNTTILKETEWFNRIIDDNGIKRAMRTWPPNGK